MQQTCDCAVIDEPLFRMKVVIMRAVRTSYCVAGWRATMVRWLLLCCVMRALLPVGYMPNFSATDASDFQFVMCTTNGGAVDPAKDGRVPADRDQGHRATEFCAFGALPVLAQPATQDRIPVPTGTMVAPATFPQQRVLNRIHVGPHVGSRAPPSFS